MWTYVQKSGEMYYDGVFSFNAYSGHGDGKNNPSMQHIHKVGPIPCGIFYQEHLFPTTDAHGPFVIQLKPDPANEMFGRSGFLMHGDSVQHPGEASEGCIIASRVNREKVWASQEPIKVVSEL
jgi:hypothetical protein